MNYWGWLTLSAAKEAAQPFVGGFMCQFDNRIMTLATLYVDSFVPASRIFLRRSITIYDFTETGKLINPSPDPILIVDDDRKMRSS